MVSFWARCAHCEDEWENDCLHPPCEVQTVGCPECGEWTECELAWEDDGGVWVERATAVQPPDYVRT